MYRIVKKLNGEFLCEGMLQDGWERWSEKTLEEAVKSIKIFGKTMNGDKVKKKHIEYYEEEVAQVSILRQRTINIVL